MKRLAALLLVLIIPGSLAAILEDFEDDTSGQDPTDPSYTYGETGTLTANVVSNGFTGQGFRTSGHGVDDGAHFTWSGYNLCDSGAVYSHRVFLEDTDTDGDWIGVVHFEDVDGWGFGFNFINPNTGNDEIQFNIKTPSQPTPNVGGTGLGQDLMPGQTWLDVEVSQVDCTLVDQVEYNLKVSNETTTFISGLRTSNGGNGGDGFSQLSKVWHGWSEDVPVSTQYFPARFDDMVWSSYDAVLTPPAGVRATVELNGNPATSTLHWLLSPDDPSLTGQYDYSIYYKADGGAETLHSTIEAGSGQEGKMQAVIDNVSAASSIEFYVKASSGGFSSLASCSVTITTTIKGNTATCGDIIPGFEQPGAQYTADDGALYGGSKSALAEALQVSETSVEYLIGLMLVLLIGAGLFFAFGPIAGAAGVFLGTITAYAFDLFDFWVIYAVAFMAAGIGILLVKARGVPNG